MQKLSYKLRILIKFLTNFTVYLLKIIFYNYKKEGTVAKNSFGQKLKQVRKAKHLTQEALAELAGINEKHISKIETGVYFPTYNTLSKILTALDLKIEDVGLDFNSLNTNNSPFYIKALQILNDAKSEQELEYYYGALRQAQKGIDILKNT